jgi:hypothetical protein
MRRLYRTLSKRTLNSTISKKTFYQDEIYENIINESLYEEKFKILIDNLSKIPFINLKISESLLKSNVLGISIDLKNNKQIFLHCNILNFEIFENENIFCIQLDLLDNDKLHYIGKYYSFITLLTSLLELERLYYDK